MTPSRDREDAVALLPDVVVRQRLAALRQRTAHHHDEVERRVDLDSRLHSRESYGDLLARLHGFYEPFEAQLEHAANQWGLMVDVEARRKAPLLVRDLTALGRAPADLRDVPRDNDIPRPTSPAAALGCLYVVEGATLGGRIIARRVEERLGIGPTNGASFFDGYGAHTGSRWRTFCSVLAAESLHEVAVDAIVGGAIETFGAYGGWLAAASASHSGRPLTSST